MAVMVVIPVSSRLGRCADLAPNGAPVLPQALRKGSGGVDLLAEVGDGVAVLAPPVRDVASVVVVVLGVTGAVVDGVSALVALGVAAADESAGLSVPAVFASFLSPHPIVDTRAAAIVTAQRVRIVIPTSMKRYGPRPQCLLALGTPRSHWITSAGGDGRTG